MIVRVPKIFAVLEGMDCATINSALCGPIKDALAVSIWLRKKSTSIKEILIDEILYIHQELANYKQMVEEMIDKDALENDEYLIEASKDEGLEELKNSLVDIESKIKKVHAKAVSDIGIDSLKLEYVSHLGYHFRLTLKDEANMRGNKNYQVIDALKGGVRFTNKALTSLNEEYLETKEKYEQQQEKIVEEMIKIALGFLGTFTRLNSQIAELDCLLSFAIAAVSAPTPYVKPKMSDKSPRVLDLKGMRHPCLELQEDITFIANDVTFKEDKTNMYIITGAF